MTTKRELKRLLSEARDLLRHDGRHVRDAGRAEFPPCPGCDLEARIDEVAGAGKDGAE